MIENIRQFLRRDANLWGWEVGFKETKYVNIYYSEVADITIYTDSSSGEILKSYEGKSYWTEKQENK